MQVDPVNFKLKPPGKQRLKLKCDVLLSISAFKLDLRCYTKANSKAGARAVADGVALVGRKINKEFDGLMYGGRVASFDPKVGWYRLTLSDPR